jgi:DNA-binding response OmpR family regulator
MEVATPELQASGAHLLVFSAQEASITPLVSALRHDEGFDVSLEKNLKAVLERSLTEQPALIFLDHEPSAKLLDLCKALRTGRSTSAMKLIIAAKANEPASRIAAFEMGIDDYIGKPFNLREAILRCKAVLRRGKLNVREERLARGPILLDPIRYQVTVAGEAVHVTAVEFKLLRSLLAHAGEVQTREMLLRAARSNGLTVESRTIDTHIRRLRAKLRDASHLVETVRGAGYRLRPV